MNKNKTTYAEVSCYIKIIVHRSTDIDWNGKNEI